MRIALTDDELRECVRLGGERVISALNKGRKGAHGFNRQYERWSIDIEGVAAEMAAAKSLGLEYVAVVGQLDTDLGDIAPGIQVRGTRYQAGSLLIHKTDHDEDRFILVTGELGDYRVRGWIKAGDGKIDKLYREYKGRFAYWVGQDWLKPLDTLVLR